MNKQKRKNYLILTMICALIIFFILTVSVLSAGVLVYILVHNNVIIETPDDVSTVKTLILYMGIFSVVFGAGIAILTSDVTAKPIRRVAVKLMQLAKGDYSVRLKFGFLLSRHPDFSEFADNFNMMAEELENTEILRSDFINNFSHEFKTPIVSIAGFAKLLKYGNLTDEQKMEYLDIIEEESLRLSALATNVLSLGKVEKQAILTDRSTFNLSEQIRSGILLLEKRWEKKKIEFSIEFEEYMILANEELLKQVWINLIDNAIKYSPEYGVITVKIREKEESYRVTVENFGIEIPEEKREKIFNKFYQAEESHASEGNGVGLAIVKKVVDLHKGSVWVECKNGVTTFLVELPKE